MQGWSNPGGWVASIDFGKTVGQIFKIWPMDKIILDIKFGQESYVPVYCHHIVFLLYSKSIHKRFFTKNWNILFLINLFAQYFCEFF